VVTTARRRRYPPCYGGSSGARTAVTPPTDWRSVARTRVRQRGLEASGRERIRARAARAARASDGARPREGRARDVALRRRSARFCFAGAVFEMNLLQIFV
jgi:hypothetical protein